MELWLDAACKVLRQANRPMHYSEIKKYAEELGFVHPKMTTNLESALCHEVKRTNRRIAPLPDNSGIFCIVQGPGLSSEKSAACSSTAAIRKCNGRYRKKYLRMKRYVKDLIFSNAAICDEVVRLEEKLTRTKEERRFLLRRVLQHESIQPQADASVTKHRADRSKVIGFRPVAAESGSSNRPITAQSVVHAGKIEKINKKSANQNKVPASFDASKVNVRGVKMVKRARQVSADRYRIPPIPVDSAGRPVLPIELNTLTLHSVGKVIPKPGYYTITHIYPVGFLSTRLYLSINPGSTYSLYMCRVTDGGTSAKFEITTDDLPGTCFTGITPSQSHKQLLEAICSARGSGAVPIETTLGAEFFGLSHPTVRYLIQSSAAAKSCVNYRWLNIEPDHSGRDIIPYVETSPAVNVKLVDLSAFCHA